MSEATDARRARATAEYEAAIRKAENSYEAVRADSRRRNGEARQARTKDFRVARKILLRENKIADMIDQNEAEKGASDSGQEAGTGA